VSAAAAPSASDELAGPVDSSGAASESGEQGPTLFSEPPGTGNAAGGEASSVSSPAGSALASFVLPGDANADGAVDGADYTIWADSFGMQNPQGAVDGDFNGDGEVDGADYTIWADNFGKNVLCVLPDVPDDAGDCCPIEQINCGNGLCQPSVQCLNGVCSGGFGGFCSCDPGWVSQSCTARCAGGPGAAGPVFCGAPACSGVGVCHDTQVFDMFNVLWSCHACECDGLTVDSGFGGDLCQFSGCGVSVLGSQGTGSFVTELESLYSCDIFGNNCNTLPVDFSDSVPELAFTIEFQMRHRGGNWRGYTILKKWGCPAHMAPNFCGPSVYTTNWQIRLGDVGGFVVNSDGKILFGAPGSVVESTIGLAAYNRVWVHVAITYDCCDPDESGLRIYVDGVLDSFHSQADAGHFFAGRNRGNIYVLDDRKSGGPNFANYDLDEVRIWNVVRTVEEINATMRTEVNVSDPDDPDDPYVADKLIYYLRFNESPDEVAMEGLTHGLTREYANGWNTALVGDAMFQTFSPVLAATPLPGPGICSTDP
jgi:hypothetical protein